MWKFSVLKPALLASVVGALSLGTASGQTLYGLRTDNSLVSFQPATPGAMTVVDTISGVTAGQTLVGMDFRPATGQLVALGYNQDPNPSLSTAQLYTINLGTAAATPIAAAFPLDLGAESAANIGFDFNPTVDRIRVVTRDTDGNFRLNPITGTLQATDGNLMYNPGSAGPPVVPADANAGRNPNVGAVAYSNSYIGATSTTMYDADMDFSTITPNTTTIILSIQNPPNAGTLNTINTGSQPSALVDLDIDIYNNLTSGVQTGYTVARYQTIVGPPPGTPVEFNLLGIIDFTTATIANQGTVGTPGPGVPTIVDLAAQIDRTAPAPGGQSFFALSATNWLLTFDSANPTFIRTAGPTTGLATGQNLVGLDVRPATGQLYALGYNPALMSGNTQVYTLDPVSRALTAVGAPITLAIGTGPVGFDFNPTVDRIRVVAANGANYRLNPTTGGLVATDGNLTPGSSIGASGYTNSFSGAGSTTLYNIDNLNDRLVTQISPNAGTLNNVGPLGFDISDTDPTYDFDIRTTLPSTNAAFLSANPAGSNNDNLYTVALGTGAATLVGRIGGGIAVRTLTATLDAPVLWTGATSSNYGTASNWSTNAVPTSADRVAIPAGTPNSPVVSNAQAAAALAVLDGAMFTVATTGAFSLGGNLLNNGIFMGTGAGLVALNGASVQILSGPGSTVFADLTVGASGATMGGGIAVERVLTLNGNLTPGTNVLTLRSSASGTALVVNSGGVVSGQATVQRHITTTSPGTAGIGYRLLSSPVSNTTVADLATTGFTPVLNSAFNTPLNPINVRPYPNVFGFDETRFGANNSSTFQQGYFSPVGSAPQALDAALQVGRGYSVYMVGTAKPDFVGTLNNGPVLVAPATGVGTPGQLTRTGTNGKTGWHLLGNPYPSPIDWDLVSVPTGMDPTVYTLRTTGGTGGVYTALTNGVGAPGTDLIASGQGFFAFVTAPTSFTFRNTARVTSYANPVVYRSAPDQRPTAHLTIRRADQAADAEADAAYVYFQNGATAAIERGIDARKRRAEGDAASIFTLTNGEELAINGLPTTSIEAATVPLGVVLPVAGTYELTAADLRNFAPGAVTLVDARTNTTYDLSAQPTMRFTVAQPGADLTRFSLRFGRGAAAVASSLSLEVYPNPTARAAGLTVAVQGLEGATATVALFDALGRAVLRQTVAVEAQAISAALDTRALPAGTYTLRLTPATGAPLTRRVVVE